MKRSKSVNLAVVPLLAAAFLTGCGGEKETAYCVDQYNTVTDNRECDRGSSSHFWFFGAPGLTRGSFAGSGERINAADKAALARRGGFGKSAQSGGVGRPTGKTIGGGGFFSGGG
jgi:hypothetical protein